MKNPHFKVGSLEIFNKRDDEIAAVSSRSILGLYFSQALLYVGFILVILNNIDVIAPGSYFGTFNWLTVIVFSIGLVINFISIPWLYLSSFEDFKKENDFWDKEVFWILPLFFFGTFFLYGSHMYLSYIIFVISVAVTAIVHFFFVHKAWKFTNKKAETSITNCHQYVISLKYLTAYYVLLLGLLIFYNPLQHLINWIRNY